MFIITLFWFKCCITLFSMMELSKQYFCGLLLYDFKSGKSATASSCCSNAAFGDSMMSECTAQDWFRYFHNGNFNLEDSPLSGRPAQVDSDQLRQLIEAVLKRLKSQILC